MLTRRDFASVASCALCSLTGFIASDASAQAPPAINGTPGVTRKILSQTDGPTPGYVTLIVDIEIEPGVMIGRHTHPGIESAYMLEGGFDLPIEGQPTKTLKPGEGVRDPAEHAACRRQERRQEEPHRLDLYCREGQAAGLARVSCRQFHLSSFRSASETSASGIHFSWRSSGAMDSGPAPPAQNSFAVLSRRRIPE